MSEKCLHVRLEMSWWGSHEVKFVFCCLSPTFSPKITFEASDFRFPALLFHFPLPCRARSPPTAHDVSQLQAVQIHNVCIYLYIYIYRFRYRRRFIVYLHIHTLIYTH